VWCLPLLLDLFERLSVNENASQKNRRSKTTIHSMPDVGLTSSAERLKEGYKVVIKYSIEIEGLPVYTESYDAEKLRKEVEANEQTLREYWFRRVKCVIGCRDRRGSTSNHSVARLMFDIFIDSDLSLGF
jgi:hypothetical protein